MQNAKVIFLLISPKSLKHHGYMSIQKHGITEHDFQIDAELFILEFSGSMVEIKGGKNVYIILYN